jgi:hypothetical protein
VGPHDVGGRVEDAVPGAGHARRLLWLQVQRYSR